ncbi:MBL fold metallo-hydrolase [Methanofollis fontis]|uniref:MBL fold metallo-hydrolase n=1 Tax=Methanofollis fontis TaxID=2052832 RepID=A0A483CR41_9EURY|nr:MBL fold metallo-hydrolase [Methanofollis fontis]TAJ43410.1 MBL fold metallo-hydrolase [Methanofollis fontis]
MFTITEIYNNIPGDSRLKTEWGFSCYIKEAALLFDTGGDAAVLASNMAALGIDPADIRTLVLSHDHWDHIGGLAAVLGRNPDLDVYLLDTFSDETKTAVQSVARMHIVRDWQEIAPGIFSTGPLAGAIPEQALALEGADGFFIITGCAHPHISTIIEDVRGHGTVHGAIGGFHAVSNTDRTALRTLPYLAPSHCTDALALIIGENAERCRQGGVGAHHTVQTKRK